MDIKKARTLVDDMLDICGQVDNETLAEASQGIYRDVHAAKSIESIMSSARELMVFVNEVPWESYDTDDLKNELENIYNQLLEDFEDFE